MALTLMLSSVAYADFLGMGNDSTYKWTISDLYQQVTDADGNDVAIDTTSLATVLTSIGSYLTSGTALYLWGYINVNAVTNTGTVPPGSAWSENGVPDTVTGVFWGIQILGVSDDGKNLLFSGGSGAFYTGTSPVDNPSTPNDESAQGADSLAALNVASYMGTSAGMADGELDVAALLTGESSWSDTGRFDDGVFSTFDWTDGVLDSDPTVTQIAVLTPGQNDSIAQGKFNLDVTSDNNFSELIDSNKYAGESDAEGSVNIQLYNDDNTENSGGWDFSGESAQLNMTTVPEPSTFLLIGLGMIGCFAYARRRRNNA
jgi:hypothetical protein